MEQKTGSLRTTTIVGPTVPKYLSLNLNNPTFIRFAEALHMFDRYLKDQSSSVHSGGAARAGAIFSHHTSPGADQTSAERHFSGWTSGSEVCPFLEGHRAPPHACRHWPDSSVSGMKKSPDCPMVRRLIPPILPPGVTRTAEIWGFFSQYRSASSGPMT